VVERYETSTVDGKVELAVSVQLAGARQELTGVGNGPIDAFTHALSDVGVRVQVRDYAEHALSAGGDARAAAYVECELDGVAAWGAGIDPDIVTASLNAVASAVNRAHRR
jgi:2-isopropylmalate synthase